jgi:hypothetical protein
MSTFYASVMAATDEDAVARVSTQVAKLEGFSLTGRVAVKSERHMLRVVEIANHGGNRNDAWVVLTSYGINPAKELGSVWQTVEGVAA